MPFYRTDEGSCFFLFFFIEGGMGFSSFKGGDREEMWRDKRCHSVCGLRFHEQVMLFLANACMHHRAAAAVFVFV